MFILKDKATASTCLQLNMFFKDLCGPCGNHNYLEITIIIKLGVDKITICLCEISFSVPLPIRALYMLSWNSVHLYVWTNTHSWPYQQHDIWFLGRDRGSDRNLFGTVLCGSRCVWYGVVCYFLLWCDLCLWGTCGVGVSLCIKVRVPTMGPLCVARVRRGWRRGGR